MDVVGRLGAPSLAAGCDLRRLRRVDGPFLHQAYELKPGGLWAGYINIWATGAAQPHLHRRVRVRAQLSPAVPDRPGQSPRLPFMVDFLAANLVPLGTSLTSSLVLTSGLLGLAFQPSCTWLALRSWAAAPPPRLRSSCFCSRWPRFLLPDRRHLPQRHPVLGHLPRDTRSIAASTFSG